MVGVVKSLLSHIKDIVLKIVGRADPYDYKKKISNQLV